MERSRQISRKTRSSTLLPYNSSTVLNEISARLCDRFDDLISKLNVDLRLDVDRYVGTCPVHGGDNTTAFNLYLAGNTYFGSWNCFTRNCHSCFASFSAVGFIRGVLSHQQYGWMTEGDRRISHREAVDYALTFLRMKIEDIKFDPEREEAQRFINDVAYLTTQVAGGGVAICDRNTYRKYLTTPPQYYLNRGYSPGVLDAYDVGLCVDKTHEMYQRVMVPIYDIKYENVVGYIGRSIFERCSKCEMYHDQRSRCPTSGDKLILYTKWLCKQHFVDKHYLYNYWKAKLHINKTRSVVIVEGPGDVWRLEEAGVHNSVALFGCELTNRQIQLLTACGNTFIVLTDADPAGERAAKLIAHHCEPFANIFRCPLPAGTKDVGGMTVEQVKRHVVPFIRSKSRIKE